eukprot:339645_1
MITKSDSVFQFKISIIYAFIASVNGFNLPWRWDTPPLWSLIESRNTPVFTDYEYEFMTNTYDIIGLGACFDTVNGITELKWYEAAAGIRQYSPSSNDTKILFYWPVPGAYTDCWNVSKKVAQNSSMWLYDDNGNLMGSQTRPQIDLTQEYVRNWWVDAIVSIIQNALDQNIIVDGVFLDGVKTWLVGVSQERRDAYDIATRLALTKLREEFNKIDPNLFMLGNGVGVLKQQVHGLDVVPYIDGVCFEHYGSFEQINSDQGTLNPDWLLTWTTVTKDIINGIYGANKSVFIKAWPGPVTAPLEALWGPSWPVAFGTRPDTYEGIAQASSELLAFPLASYLCGIYQESAYFSYSWWWAVHQGWIPCPYDPSSCMAPSAWYPELSTILGQPLGDGVFTNTYECRRSFENANIYIDLRNYSSTVFDWIITDAPTEAPTYSPTIYEPYELILRQKSDYYFTNPLLENEYNSHANTYSIIHIFNETKRNKYKGVDDKWQFRLVYKYSDNSQDIIIWKQSSWLLEQSIIDYEEISVPTQTFADTFPQYFRGLGLNVVFAGYSLLDGDGILNDDAWNCVGTKRAFNNGIVAFNGKIAKTAALYIFDEWVTNLTPYPVTQQPTNSPINIPTDSPIIPTDSPTKPTQIYQLILTNKPDYYFSNPLLENPNDPNANTYSIIDTIDETNSIYKGTDNKYEFKLIYDGYSDNSQDVIIWKQSSWLLEGIIIGYQAIEIPTQTYTEGNPAYFRGLGLNVAFPNFALLDGDGTYFDNAMNCVGQKRAWNDVNTGEYGILAFNAKIAKTSTLYIRDFSTSHPTNYPTSYPSSQTIFPTKTPSKSVTKTSTDLPSKISTILVETSNYLVMTEKSENNGDSYGGNATESFTETIGFVILIIVIVVLLLAFCAILFVMRRKKKNNCKQVKTDVELQQKTNEGNNNNTEKDDEPDMDPNSPQSPLTASGNDTTNIVASADFDGE